MIKQKLTSFFFKLKLRLESKNLEKIFFIFVKNRFPDEKLFISLQVFFLYFSLHNSRSMTPSDGQNLI